MVGDPTIKESEDRSDWSILPTVEEMNRYTEMTVAIITSHLYRLQTLGDSRVGPELNEEIDLLIEVSEADQRTIMGVVSELTRLAGLGLATSARLVDRSPLEVLESVAPAFFRSGEESNS
jgi:hypothetical protein